jgi:putative ABC transport system ATP-binding protein
MRYPQPKGRLAPTVMMHEGQSALDLSGERRARTSVPELLGLYGTLCGGEVSDDALLLR